MNKTISLSISLALTLLAVSLALPAYAVTTPATSATAATTSTTDIATKKKAADDALTVYKAAKAIDKLTKLQTLGDKLIDHRLATLNEFVTNITKNKPLSADQIASLKTEATTVIDALTTLKAKIDADTSVDTAKADVKSIFDTYHVYAVFMPSLHLTAALDELQALVDKLSVLSTRIQKAIDAKTTAGEDVTALTTAFTDYKIQLTDAAASLATAKTEIAKLNPLDVSASKTPMANARDALTKARASVVAARGDLTTIRDGLKTTAASSSATPSGSTSSTTTKSTTTK